MNSIEFLSTIHNPSQLLAYKIILLYGKTYPFLYIAHIFKSIKAIQRTQSHNSNSSTEFFTVDATLVDIRELMIQLSMSFLGQSSVYWVKNIHELDSASKKIWNKFIKEYEGPHVLMYYDTAALKTADESHLSVELPEKVTKHLYASFYSFFNPHAPIDSAIVNALFQRKDALTLDEACMLIEYQSVLGKNAEAFFKQWFSKLVVPQQSLFQLSQYFFARQPKLFFEHWKGCKTEYPEEFWTVYWSEQLWQAVLFITTAKQQGYESAKKGFYRLPFSFINKDWQKHSVERLAQAHQFIYQFDYNLKNGASDSCLELMFHKFM